MNNPEPTPFQLLLDDLAELQRVKYGRPGAAPAPSRRDTVTRATVARPQVMKKSLPDLPVKPVDFDRIARDQEKLEKAMREAEARTTKNAIRSRLGELYMMAKSGRLSAMDVCRLDAIRCRAVDMGLKL